MNLYLFDEYGNPTNAPDYIEARTHLESLGFEDTGDCRVWDSNPVQDIEIPSLIFEHDTKVMRVELAYDGHFCVGETNVTSLKIIGMGLNSLKRALKDVYYV